MSAISRRGMRTDRLAWEVFCFFALCAHLLIGISQCLPLAACRQTLRNLLFCLLLSALLITCGCAAEVSAGPSVFECVYHADATLSAATIQFLASGFFFFFFSCDRVACHSLVILLGPQTALMIVQHRPCYCNFVHGAINLSLSGSMSMSQAGWLQD